jgi:hypothetical protein
VLGTEYRADYQAAVGFAFGYGRAAMVWISPDPTGRYLLFSYETGYGFYIGWLEQGEFHLLPEKQPYLDVPGPWSPAW